MWNSSRNLFSFLRRQYGPVFGDHNEQTYARITTEELLSEPAVVAGIGMIADNFAQQPIKVLNNKKEESPAHRVAELLRYPNDIQTGYEFMQSLVDNLYRFGNVFIRIVRTRPDEMGGVMGANRNNYNAPIALYIMPSDQVKVTPKGDMRVYYQIIDGGGGSEQNYIDADNVIHIQDYDRGDILGESRLKLGAQAIRNKIEADRRAMHIFKYGFDVGTFVIYKDSQGESFFEEMRKKFQEKFTRAGGKEVNLDPFSDVNVDANMRIAFLDKGPEVKQVKGMTPADADIVKLNQAYLMQIAALLKIPPYFIGGEGDSKYNNVRQRLISFYRDTIAPLNRKVEMAFERKLLPRGLTLKFDVSAFVHGDYSETVNNAVRMAGAGAMTVNEWREAVGLMPFDDERGDVLLSSSSVNSDEDPATGGEDGPGGGENPEGDDDND